MPILEVRNISKTFGKTPVLEDISFELEKGRTLALIGSSGSGKTTLLRCLNFLETPDTGVIQVNQKFRTVLLSLVLGSIGVGVLGFLGSLIPATRPYVQSMMNNAGFTVLMDVVGLVIASLFLISDFAMVHDCVKEGYPKHYEWSAAFGLVFTVIWIYLKILDLLMQVAGKKKD